MSKFNRPLNQYSKEELKDMHERGIICKCMSCNKYHACNNTHEVFGERAFNITTCEKCMEEKGNGREL